jgi:deoxyribodipyrimidine photolyase-related protein
MPGYLESNHFDAGEPLPQFYWNADTPLSCLHHCVSETLTNGYAHHIQRLMVLGLYSLMLGVKPKEIHAWFLGVYADAVEWVEAPNVIGMSQFADGGRMSSKPYIATGKYIKRMSNYCQSCPRDPDQATGPKACPFTTLYWDFLIRHEDSLRGNQRLAFQLKNLGRLNAERRQAVTAEAARIRQDPSCQGNHPDQGSLF